MIDIVRLLPHEMEERDKLDLIKFSKADYNGRSPLDFIEAMLQDLFQLWRVSEGEDRGILITKVLATARGGRTLYIEGMAGMGVMKRPKELVEVLFGLARSANCQSITGWVQRDGMVRWMESAELPLVASVFMKEVPDAPQELAQSAD